MSNPKNSALQKYLFVLDANFLKMSTYLCCKELHFISSMPRRTHYRRRQFLQDMKFDLKNKIVSIYYIEHRTWDALIFCNDTTEFSFWNTIFKHYDLLSEQITLPLNKFMYIVCSERAKRNLDQTIMCIIVASKLCTKSQLHNFHCIMLSWQAYC